MTPTPTPTRPPATRTAAPTPAGFEEDYSHGGTRDDNDEAEYPQIAAETQSLREHLISQLSLTQISEHDQKLVTLLIDSLDDDGYLHQDLAELVAMLPPELDIEIEDLQRRIAAPAEPRSAGRGRARSRRMPEAAARGAAGRHAVSRARRWKSSTITSTCSPRAISPG